MAGLIRSTVSALSNPRSWSFGKIMTVLFVALLLGNELLFVGASIDTLAETLVHPAPAVGMALRVVTAILVLALFAYMVRLMLKTPEPSSTEPSSTEK